MIAVESHVLVYADRRDSEWHHGSGDGACPDEGGCGLGSHWRRPRFSRFPGLVTRNSLLDSGGGPRGCCSCSSSAIYAAAGYSLWVRRAGLFKPKWPARCAAAAYSLRNTSTGCTSIARRAGTTLAAPATVRSRPPVARKVVGSVGWTP